MNAEEKSARATLGGGCFWCVEAVYQTVPGILSVISGYAGGQVPNPTYEQVCTGRTGHAEVVQIEFETDKISYEQIIDLFWKAHDPTTLNRQGGDTAGIGRSSSTRTRRRRPSPRGRRARHVTKDPIVTEIEPLKAFLSG
jgi:peptide-methionine (S)-S-oxide reductase